MQRSGSFSVWLWTVHAHRNPRPLAQHDFVARAYGQDYRFASVNILTLLSWLESGGHGRGGFVLSGEGHVRQSVDLEGFCIDFSSITDTDSWWRREENSSGCGRPFAPQAGKSQNLHTPITPQETCATLNQSPKIFVVNAFSYEPPSSLHGGDRRAPLDYNPFLLEEAKEHRILRIRNLLETCRGWMPLLTEQASRPCVAAHIPNFSDFWILTSV